MKKTFFLAGLLAITFCCTAQLKGILDRAKQKAANKASQKVDKSIDKAADSTSGKTDKQPTVETNNKDTETANTNKSNAAGSPSSSSQC